MNSADTEGQAHRRPRRPQRLPDPPASSLNTQMESENAGWQALQRYWRPQGLPNPPAWLLLNRFTRLPEEVEEGDSAYLQEYPKRPSQSQKTSVVSKMKKRPTVLTQVVSSQRLTAPGAPSRMEAAISCLEKFRIKLPHSYWMLGTLQTCWVCVSLTLLVPEDGRALSHEGAHGTLADGSCISFYETFIVSQLKDNAILGMPFLEKH